MRRADFHYDLPPDLIAQVPPAARGDSRMLFLDGGSGERRDLMFADLPGLLLPGDLLVFNDTRVIPARLFGVKPTGGRIEMLVERITAECEALVHLRASKATRPGTVLRVEDAVDVEVLERAGDLYRVRFPRAVLAVLREVGHMPLPPYIERAAGSEDSDRYQTVYARRDGAVAAPTAGLHFGDALLARLAEMGIGRAFVTLHVGAGTFQPVRAELLADHRMHSEWLEVPPETVETIAATRAAGGRVVAVGTTVVRSLESAARGGTLAPFAGETDIFIHPGFRFHVVDALLTNFHLPESTLLMLVSAFAGHGHVMAAYRHAVKQKYRFFSYGDAMFVLPQRPVDTAVTSAD